MVPLILGNPQLELKLGGQTYSGLRLATLQLSLYMSYSLNSLKGGYLGDYIGDYYRGY